MKRHRHGNNQLISHERLTGLVSYCPETGLFSSSMPRQGIRDPSRLGTLERSGYRRIQIDGVRYLAHRLAWFYVHREWPVDEVDHRDLNRDNNRIANLRPATTSQNHANARQPSGTRAPLKGAHWNRFRDCWQSYIKINGKSIFLGRFGTAEAAHLAYVRAATELRGEFARAA